MSIRDRYENGANPAFIQDEREARRRMERELEELERKNECSICRGFHGPEIRHACE